MGRPEWKNSIPTLGGIRKTSLAFGGHVWWVVGGLQEFSVFSPSPFGFGFGTKGLGPGLDNNNE